MPSIQTLIPDIYKYVESHEELSIPIVIRFGERREPPTLRLSKMGPICPKHLWHSVHTPELAEPFPAPAIIKFTYGHTIEAMAIALAKAAGHEVTGEQDELVVAGIKGHRDCVIDGMVVDVKSCSSRMFQKFETKSIREDDPFGYLDQMDGYLVGSANDDLVRYKDRAAILAIDKTLGKMVLYEHHLREARILATVARYKNIVAEATPGECTCEEIPDGKSGNLRLGVKSSYSAFKHVCFPHLRTFLYSDGPRYLTRVVRKPEPHIVEIDKFGKRVYN